MNQLEQARETINRLDRQIASLFEQRMNAVIPIAQYKQEHLLPIFDPKREEQLLRDHQAFLEDPKLAPYYKEFLTAFMQISKKYQSAILCANKVGYAGVEGAFSHIAVQKLFPDAKQCAYTTFEQVFEAVENGELTNGVIPFENSYTGEVGEVLDLLRKHDCHIHAVYDLPIRQNLLVLPQTSLSQIKQVYSHPQAIGQSCRFLEQYPFEVIPYANTALAAKYVSEQQDPSKAAIASVETAQLYGLEVLVPNINTSAENTTRFIVIARPLLEEGNRFSLLFTVKHDAGQLAKVMQVIGAQGFNLESIKSRPIHNQPWQYYFYAELVGSLADERSKNLLSQLQNSCESCKVIGTYAV